MPNSTFYGIGTKIVTRAIPSALQCRSAAPALLFDRLIIDPAPHIGCVAGCVIEQLITNPALFDYVFRNLTAGASDSFGNGRFTLCE